MPFDTDFDGTVEPVLEEMVDATGLEGLVIVDVAGAEAAPRVLYTTGVAGPRTVVEGQALLLSRRDGPAHRLASDRRPILTCPWTLPPNRFGGVVLWRQPGAAAWQDADTPLASALGILLRTIVAAGAGQIGIDRTTGLPNRRWFLEEVDRHLDRMALDGGAGTLTLIEVSNLAQINAASGRDIGNAVLVRLAAQLRTTVRPGDAVARIGLEHFALWQPAMDHMTAAERANVLCTAPPPPDLPPGIAARLSIGIVHCAPDSGEDVRSMLRRAIREVKQVRSERAGGWRVSRDDVPRPGSPSDMKT